MCGVALKELRKEKGLTQEQLGEKIGVTNKTVSRWETGTYLPPVECLEMLSDIYGVSINEIVAGQRLSGEELAEAADENLSDALGLSESVYKKRERSLTVTFIISTVLAMAIICLMPFDKDNMAKGIVLIILIVALAFISNTVNIVALALNHERFEKKQ